MQLKSHYLILLLHFLSPFQNIFIFIPLSLKSINIIGINNDISEHIFDKFLKLWHPFKGTQGPKLGNKIKNTLFLFPAILSYNGLLYFQCFARICPLNYHGGGSGCVEVAGGVLSLAHLMGLGPISLGMNFRSNSTLQSYGLGGHQPRPSGFFWAIYVRQMTSQKSY